VGQQCFILLLVWGCLLQDVGTSLVTVLYCCQGQAVEQRVGMMDLTSIASSTPMLLQGDQLNQYCSGPQSVASLTLPNTNLTGTIPQTFFSSMVDLQTLMLDDNLVCVQPHAMHVTM